MKTANPTHQVQATCNQMRVAFLLLIASMALPVSAEQHALLVGVSDYQDERIPDLEGPVNDVEALATVLNTVWKFKAENIHTLLNHEATESGILQALDALGQTTQPGDDVLVYFSGHGTSAHDPQLGAFLHLPDGSGALVSSDFNPELAAGNSSGQSLDDGMLVGRHELRPRLEALDRQRNVLVVFDTCYSGNAARNQFATAPQHQVRNLSLVNFRLQETPRSIEQFKPPLTRGCTNCTENLSEKFRYDNLVYFGAAAEDQLAVDFSQAEIDAGLVTTFDGKPHGGFTDSLLRVLSDSQSTEAPLSYGRLFNLLLNKFNKYCSHCGHNPVSLPIINDDTNELLQRTFFAGSTPQPASNSDSKPIASASKINAKTTTLGIALRDKSDSGIDTPKVLRNLVQEYSPTTKTPDISFNLETEILVAYAADGLMIREFDRTVSTTELSQWLEARQWLKDRQATDSQLSDGQLSVEFRHPLLGNRVAGGDSVFFNLYSETDTSMVILVMNSAGELSLLYPATADEAKRIMRAGSRSRLPAKNEAAIEVTPPWGTDTVLFYALPPGLPDDLALHSLSASRSIDPANPVFSAFETALDSGKVAYSSRTIRIVSRGSP